MYSTTIATIDLNALTHNLSLLQHFLPRKKIIAMIKSNAYGHGLVPVAKKLSAVDAFGVATLAEAQQLRLFGITNKIVVMRGFVTQEELSVYLNDPTLIACVHDHYQLQLLEERQKLLGNNTHQRALHIWLKVDTGMHRLGFLENEFDAIYSRIHAIDFIHRDFVVCSHLADADNVDTSFTKQQIKCFEKITRAISNEKSLLNSAGIMAYSDFAYDWIRPGLMLYGISPFISTKIPLSLQPAMTLQAKLIATKEIQAGDKVGYSGTFTAKQAMKIGIVGMGYGDSYPRQAKTGTPILVQGVRCPIVGRVSMDMIIVDISAVPQAKVNDEVILWGKDLLVSEISWSIDTVPHELLCHLTGRVQYRLI